MNSNIFRLDIYIDRTSPQFELKRFIIKIKLEDFGTILDSIPVANDLLANGYSYYKLVYSTNLNQNEIVKLLNVSDINIVCIDENNKDLHSRYKDCNVFIERKLNKYTVVSIHKDLINISEVKGDKNFDCIDRNHMDIYGSQLMEALKKEEGFYVKS